MCLFCILLSHSSCLEQILLSSLAAYACVHSRQLYVQNTKILENLVSSILILSARLFSVKSC